jgi:hypothetical protein
LTKSTNRFRRAERELGETLTALRGILLQIAEFALFVTGLTYLVVRMLK